jgi:hypothetical protein
MVVFDSSSSSAAFHGHPNNSILLSCQDGPQRPTGFVKRGRPKKGKSPRHSSFTPLPFPWHYWTERQTHPLTKFDEDLQINETSTKSKFSFITYTASPKNAAPNFKRLVRRRAMLTYRQQEREKKSVSEKARSARSSHSSLEGKNDDNEAFRQHVADGRTNSVLPLTTYHLVPKEITAVDPFNAFPTKIQPYMLDLLVSYRSYHGLFLAFYCFPFAFL